MREGPDYDPVFAMKKVIAHVNWAILELHRHPFHDERNSLQKIKARLQMRLERMQSGEPEQEPAPRGSEPPKPAARQPEPPAPAPPPAPEPRRPQPHGPYPPTKPQKVIRAETAYMEKVKASVQARLDTMKTQNPRISDTDR